jgi:preprotein translocase subunit YajC
MSRQSGTCTCGKRALVRGDRVLMADGCTGTLEMVDDAGEALVLCALDAKGVAVPLGQRYVATPASGLVRA